MSDNQAASVKLLQLDQPEVKAAIRVQEENTSALMRTAGVIGTAVGADDAGNVVVKVFTETALPAGRIPDHFGAFRVEQEVTGKIIAFKGHGGGGSSHTAKQTPPIQLGTSGGSVTDLANGFCCSGTLGSLVTKNGVQYILSNSHVFAGDVVSGGNGKVAAIGDDVTQPGYVDNNCSTSNTNHVADVSSLSTLYPPNSTPNVDCAIAQVVSGMVSTTGAILEVGTISHNTVAAAVGQAVKKSGRTTGLSRSTISALNATVSVGYETECGGSSFTKTFTGQMHHQQPEKLVPQLRRLGLLDGRRRDHESACRRTAVRGQQHDRGRKSDRRRARAPRRDDGGQLALRRCGEAMRVMLLRRRPVSVAGRAPLVACALALAAVAGCQSHPPAESPAQMSNRTLSETLAAHSSELMAIPGVVGVAEGEQPDHTPCLLVMVEKLTPEIERRVPKRLDGHPVRIEVTGAFHAMPDSAR
jgi:hypothetical protein